MPTAVDPIANIFAGSSDGEYHQPETLGPDNIAKKSNQPQMSMAQYQAQRQSEAAGGGTPNPTPGTNPITADSGASLAGTTGAETFTQDIDESTLSSNLVTDMTSKDSRYMEHARKGGERQAQSRGLLNSSLSAGAAEGAAIDRAAPFALQDSQSYLAQSLQNQTEMNASERFNANALNTASLANSQAENQLIQGEYDTANTLEIMEGQTQQSMDLAAQAFGFDTMLQATEAGFTQEQIAQQGEIAGTLAAQSFGFDTILQANEAGFTLEQLSAQAQHDRDNAAQMFGFDTELQATAAGFSMAELQESGAISANLAAQAFGFDTLMQAQEAGFTEEQIAQQGQIEMDLALDAFGFDSALAAQQGGIDLGLIAAQAQDAMELASQAFGFDTLSDAQNAGYSIDQIRERGKAESNLLAEQAGFDNARLALQNGYTLDQMREQGTIDTESRNQAAEIEKTLEAQRQTGDIDLQDLKNGAALKLANIEADYRQTIALNASAASAFQSYQTAAADLMNNPDMGPDQINNRLGPLLDALSANLTVIGDIGGQNFDSYTQNIGSVGSGGTGINTGEIVSQTPEEEAPPATDPPATAPPVTAPPATAPPGGGGGGGGGRVDVGGTSGWNPPTGSGGGRGGRGGGRGYGRNQVRQA